MEEPKRRGRPKGSGREPKNYTINVRMSEKDLALLDRISTEEDIPVSQVIRKAVKLYGNTWNRDYYF